MKSSSTLSLFTLKLIPLPHFSDFFSCPLSRLQAPGSFFLLENVRQIDGGMLVTTSCNNPMKLARSSRDKTCAPLLFAKSKHTKKKATKIWAPRKVTVLRTQKYSEDFCAQVGKYNKDFNSLESSYLKNCFCLPELPKP